MRIYPAGFTAEKNKKTDIAPVWFLRLTVSGVDYWLSDNTFTVPVWQGGITTRPWIKSWGQLQEGITGSLDEFHISDFSCSCLIDQDAEINMESLATLHNLEESQTELYLWFHGLDPVTDPPQRMWRGYVKDCPMPDDLTVELSLEDESMKLNNYVGRKVNTISHPLADPDDVGKMIPIVFGTVEKLRGVCVDSGWVTSIVADVAAAATSFTVSELPPYAVLNKIVTIDDEQVLIQSVAGTALTVIRGYNGTIATIHSKGSTVIEKKSTPLVYLLADHSLDSIGTVFARVRDVDIDITADVTKYLGTVSNQLSAYPGQAAITIPDFAAVKQRITLAINNSLAINDAAHTHVAGTLSTVTPSNLTQYVSDVGTHSTSINLRGTLGTGQYVNYWGNLYWNISPPPGTILSSTITITVSCPAGSYIFFAGVQVAANTPKYVNQPVSFSFDPASQATAMNTSGGIIRIAILLGSIWLNQSELVNYDYILTGSATVNPGSRQITYNTTTTANVAIAAAPSQVSIGGTVALSGNSVADIMVGDMLLADVTRNITAPASVLQTLLTAYGGGATVATIGTMPVGYLFNGAITEYRRLLEWCNVLAFQCRCRFRMSNGSAQLIVRTAPLTPVKTIDHCVQNSGMRVLSRTKAPLEEVINKISVLFDRDWTKSGDTAYRQTSAATAANSIAIFGERERPELFKFDFVTTPTMAASVRDFYLAWNAVRRWRYTFDTYLDQCELEFSDAVALGFLSGQATEITAARLNPGESTRMDKITFVTEG